MSSKKIVEVNLLNSDEANKFIEIFSDMLYTDKINCEGDYLVVETLDKIYKVPFSLFYVNIIETFDNVFREYYSVKKILNTPDLLFGVTNSIFEKIKLKEREKLLVNLKEKILNDEEFANTLKERIFTILSREKNFNLRKLWINRIEEFGILDVEDKVVLSYYSNLSPEELKKLFDEGIIADNQKLTVVMDACKYKRLEEKKVAKKRANSGVINIINTLLSSDYIVKLYTYFDEIKEENEIKFREFIRDDEFIKSKVKKEDILNVDFETLTVFLRDKNPKMPNSLKITSKDLINQYGRLFDGQQIYKLAVYGFIDSQVLIEVYEINEALKYINYDGRILENDELDEFYSPKALIGMKLNGDISPKFAQSYVEMQDFENNKEKFKEKSESLIENLRILTGDKKSQEFQENLLFFFKIGFCDLENAKQNISEEYIENKISNNEMKIEEVFELYEKGLLNDDFMLKYYKPEEIFEFYKNDEITGKSLRLVNDVDFLTQKFCDREIDIQDFLNLYLTEDILSVYDLDDALVLAESDVDISNFIDENVYFEKIKELFSNYLIDYSFILTLKEQQIINENEFNEIKATLDTREFFQELEEGKKFVVVTSREQNIQKGKKTTSSSDKKKNDFSDEIDLISKVLEKDVENESYSVIESYNKKGRPTSLNNYRIFGNENLDGVIILQKSKKENAIYVMNALQLMYFLRGKENSAGEIEIQDRMKDKSYLKTIAGVEVIEHSKEFARNLVEALSRVSPKISEKLRDDSLYKEEVDKMVINMREKYLANKTKGRNEE